MKVHGYLQYGKSLTIVFSGFHQVRENSPLKDVCASEWKVRFVGKTNRVPVSTDY
jgi:hypothetical protein